MGFLWETKEAARFMLWKMLLNSSVIFIKEETFWVWERCDIVQEEPDSDSQMKS